MSYLLKDFGVTCIKDLADLYGSADLIADVGKCLSQIEMKRFKKAAALTSCLAGESFPTLGESLLEEVEALNKVLEKSRMESRSATGATAVRIDILKKEVENLKSKEREDAIKTAKRKATELALTTKVAATHAKKMSILGKEVN
jgi:hypothetical protein